MITKINDEDETIMAIKIFKFCSSKRLTINKPFLTKIGGNNKF